MLLGDMFRNEWAFAGEGEEWGPRAGSLDWSAVLSWSLLCGSGGGGWRVLGRSRRSISSQSFLEDEEAGRAAAGVARPPLGQALRESCGLQHPCRGAPSTFL